MSNISLQHGDCLELMKNIPNKSVDCIITDLPYQQTSRNKWDVIIPFEPLWEQYKRITKDNAAIILFANGMFTAELMMSNKRMWRYNLIWKKTQPTGFLNAKKMPLRCHEDICIFYKKLPTYNPQKTTGHVRKVSKSALHPTQKPLLLLEELVKTYTNEGDLVLDSCMGSGTTGLACKNLNRNFIGIEKEKKYFEIAKERIGI